jgi:hypothetical protein
MPVKAVTVDHCGSFALDATSKGWRISVTALLQHRNVRDQLHAGAPARHAIHHESIHELIGFLELLAWIVFAEFRRKPDFRPKSTQS